ncbi:hypothetical protein [Marivivens marinus]|uniref:hypothetical protein n=1 Tax=Marivivens marinus TaxID=3110173 RepID=UPI003B84AFC8
MMRIRMDHDDPFLRAGLPPAPPFWVSVGRMVLRLALIGVLVLAGYWAMDWVMRNEAAETWPVILGLILIYGFLISIPFLPGIEVGLGLLLMEGPDVAPLVWAGTVVGLSLAYCVGHFLPGRMLHTFFADLRMVQACQLVDRLDRLPPEDRLSWLRARLPGWIAARLGTGRYVILGLVVNLPGSALIGGGGGIALTAGLSRLFRPGLVVLTFVIATSPVPIAVMIWGPQVADWLANRG